jgi:hypothetical protein
MDKIMDKQTIQDLKFWSDKFNAADVIVDPKKRKEVKDSAEAMINFYLDKYNNFKKLVK